jgi:hypothetical protein
MTDEQQPPAPPPPPYEPPPPPSHGPFAFPPPPEPAPTHGVAGAPAGSVFPIDIGRTFDLTFSIYRNRWRTLVGIGLIIEAVMALASLALLLGPQSRVFTDFSGRVPTQAEINAFLASLGPTLALSLVFIVLVVVAGAIQLGAMTDAVARIYAGRPVTAVTSLRRGLGRWLTFVAVMLLLILGLIAVFLAGFVVLAVAALALIAVTKSVGLAIFVVLIVYVSIFVALIFVAVRWSMAVQTVMIDGLGARAAMSRSWRLVAGSGWRVIGYYLAFWILTLVITLIIGTVVNLLINPYQTSGFRIVSIDYTKLAISTVLSALLGSFVAPLTAIPAILLYLDLRFRHGEFINPPGQGALTPSGQDGSVSE